MQTNHENIFHFGRNKKSANIRSTASLLEYLGYEMKCLPQNNETKKMSFKFKFYLDVEEEVA